MIQEFVWPSSPRSSVSRWPPGSSPVSALHNVFLGGFIAVFTGGAIEW